MPDFSGCADIGIKVFYVGIADPCNRSGPAYGQLKLVIRIPAGNRKIVFKKSVPRNFAYQSELLHLVVSVMKEIEEENINDDVVHKLRKYSPITLLLMA